ncbi:MAG: tRNA pseudouridine(38-40) synthase TruA [Chloroflexi bacterium]|nr:tRNA pseudouridine(38-40) synthase TruA [Chloroflexota bacterium]
MQRNFAAIVQYDGTDFAGFQLQTDRPTIQGALEETLSVICQSPIRLAGAGRTDAGVHARAQVVSFSCAWAREVRELQRAWNARLPDSIAVQSLVVAPDDFHARRSARARTYRYVIDNRAVRAPLANRYAWSVTRPLDERQMHAAVQGYIGRHDFIAFGNPPKRERSAVRDLLAARCWRAVDRVTVELTANAFLHGMVRRMAGALAALGGGQLLPEAFAALLPARDKARVKWVAPPHGLCLWRVEYERDPLERSGGPDFEEPK